ncbi:hypothetical protein PR048_030201 [Dryococelus australis]|uniref:Uncharacterized protein n=1 Tax=Dryococelus australis TaxID=614101 RepID=A0ABQ9GB11_9NEOP|nr:hypothetical protein PR048_030201 [Dryococelus australis]
MKTGRYVKGIQPNGIACYDDVSRDLVQRRNARAEETGDPHYNPADQQHRPARFPHATVRLLASHHGELGSIPGRVTPGFSQVKIIPDDTVGRRVFSGISILTSLHPRRLSRPRLFINVYLTRATGAERLARSPPTKANRAQSPPGSPDFRKWESCGTTPLIGGFSRGSPISPAPSFQRCSIFTSIALIGSQEPRCRRQECSQSSLPQCATTRRGVPANHNETVMFTRPARDWPMLGAKFKWIEHRLTPLV